ncbi:ribosomal protein S15 [Coccidioides immitis RS]|uniref:Ribosomal protein S15 n=2 Tax=Coccidioides immitis TaxID=5501 RepID=J3KBI0_COCIM|nr:ribosomal protein S15 [Coccidioides immitis RS]EAS32476.3 ribosomal protein S15 [Coccidioides immitis RS]KMU82799.1 hypothetical protein CIHG_00582 [Coccidioides immitis H538.4]TPX25274.1 hypothetical protein DIZ76_010725 [Coccidioides immitis]
MPPRIPIQSCSKSLNGPLYNWFAGLSLGPSVYSRSASSKTKRQKKHYDPFALAQARQRKAANLSRQRVLKEEREAARGDPVVGKPTALTEALLNGQVIPPSSPAAASEASASSSDLNFFLSADELNFALARSEKNTQPVVEEGPSFDPQKAEEEAKRHSDKHKNAEEAVRRIMQMNNASSKDRTRLNIQRCIETFGRHNTDAALPPKPEAAPHPSAPQHPPRPSRAGPDTGSSEVQIAILTTKILTLAKQLETTSHKDKHNKRNLRLLVHKRQKLLNYLRKKERGGPRWQNLVNTLGLSDATWKGEISL